ncbi:MAG: 50S ribosomal protein L29 [Candidatus Obscuribacterales bacterium]|nr:50S ribosomal protein L29 [Candidatus Obscuribacterales bacterium]
MKVKEMRDLSTEDITAKVIEARKEIIELRFQLAARKLESPANIRKAKKRLARLLTIQTEKHLGVKR